MRSMFRKVFFLAPLPRRHGPRLVTLTHGIFSIAPNKRERSPPVAAQIDPPLSSQPNSYMHAGSRYIYIIFS